MKFSKIISVILSLLIVFSFSSCKNKKPSSELEGTSDPNNSTIEKVDGSYIVKGGQSLYSIVISDNPSETEYFAASELRDFVESSIGVVLPIKSDKESSLSNTTTANITHPSGNNIFSANQSAKLFLV